MAAGRITDMEKIEQEAAGQMFQQRHWNIFYLLSAFCTLIISLTVAIQPLFLDKVIAIPYEEEGTINANIIVVTQIFVLVIVGYYGSIWQRNRRTTIILAGFMLAAFGSLLAPFSKDIEVLIGFGALAFYYLVRIIISVGTDSIQMELSSLGGDAAKPERKPEVLINMVTMMALGSTVLCAILMQVMEDSYRLTSLMLIPCLIGLAGAAVTKLLPSRSPIKNSEPLQFKKTWEAMVKDPRMQLCLATAFYVRADMIVLSLFLSLWCISYADVVEISRSNAVAHAALLLGFLGLVILSALPFWKSYLGKSSRVSAIGASLSLAGVGLVIIGTLTNPFDWKILLPLMLIGIGQAGCLVVPKVLAAELSPKGLLGSVQGLLFLVSGAGVIMMVQSGGYFFDAMGPQSPFVLIGTGHLLAMLYAVWLIKTGADKNEAGGLKTDRQVNLRPLIFLSAMLPIIWLIGRVMVAGVVPGSSIGHMPVGFINRYLGDWAFNFLLISLALTPISKKMQISSMASYSRMIGLYAFFYALLHLTTYVWLEWLFQWQDIVQDVYERGFIIFGLVAFLLLTLLTITSTKKAIAKLGWQKWKKIHQLIYVVNLLVALHFIFAATHENGEPFVYAAVVAVLLFYRVASKRKKTIALKE